MLKVKYRREGRAMAYNRSGMRATSFGTSSEDDHARLTIRLRETEDDELSFILGRFTMFEMTI